VIVDYLRAIGITDCYASSYLKAVPGSPHGYDVADPTRLNPEIGSDEDYQAWLDALADAGMGHLLDLVPNHMGLARGSNPWWTDVLEHGPSSIYARFFDIDWQPIKAELTNKVLLPVLDGRYGDVLERQELVLGYRDGGFAIGYHEERFPIAPDTYGPILEKVLDDAPGEESPERGAFLTIRGLIESCERLPTRTTRDPAERTRRARESTELKGQLAALVRTSGALSEAISSAIRWFNGRRGDPRTFDALHALLNQQ
jgi:(1->4)-alpha-D-glucan 1-alpha-D-glucosylmutase